MFRNILNFELYFWEIFEDFWEIFEDNTGSRKDVNLASVVIVSTRLFKNSNIPESIYSFFMSKIILNKCKCKDSFLNHKNLSSTKKPFLYTLVSHWVYQNQSQHNILHTHTHTQKNLWVRHGLGPKTKLGGFANKYAIWFWSSCYFRQCQMRSLLCLRTLMTLSAKPPRMLEPLPALMSFVLSMNQQRLPLHMDWTKR